MKYEKVEYLKALEAGTRLSNQEKDDLKATFDSIEKQFKDNNQDIDDYLIASFGISFRMYKEISERSKIASKFSTLQISQIEASDDEIENYYNENIDRYFTVNVRHILLLTTDDEGEPLDEEVLEEKEQLAQELLERVNAGENMDELVEEYSEDPGAQYNFGYYDVEKNAGYAPEFEEWSLNSQIGDTGIVETDFGFHIMKTYKVTSFDDIRLAVKRDLQTTIYSERITAWVDEYYIEIFDSVYDSINPLE
jgi:parvulin-like peptidyl-prolyl isomerase